MTIIYFNFFFFLICDYNCKSFSTQIMRKSVCVFFFIEIVVFIEWRTGLKVHLNKKLDWFFFSFLQKFIYFVCKWMIMWYNWGTHITIWKPCKKWKTEIKSVFVSRYACIVKIFCDINVMHHHHPYPYVIRIHIVHWKWLFKELYYFFFLVFCFFYIFLYLCVGCVYIY